MTKQCVNTSCFRTFALLKRDAHGSLSVVFGFALLILSASVGAALDYGRWVSARHQTQNAVDAALLAASRVAQLTGDSAQAITAATEHYDKMKSADVTNGDIRFVSGASLNDWKVAGEGKVSTPFLTLIGLSTLPVKPRASASVALGGANDSNLEISLMLDLTGSMCPAGVEPCSSGPKIDALKKAAADLINLVVWDDQTTTTSRVALVPFAHRIRVGADGSAEGAQMMKKLTNLDRYYTGTAWDCSGWVVSGTPGSGGTSEGGGSGGQTWTCPEGKYVFPKVNLQVAPCVTDRFRQPQWDYWTSNGTNDLQWNLSDAKPGIDVWLNAADGTRMPASESSSDIKPNWGTGKGPVNNKNAPPADRKADAWQSGSYNDSGSCWGSPVNNIIMPLTSDKSALLDRINGFEAYGPTGGAMATQWAWYMLSPNWGDVWPDESRAGSYADLDETTASGAPKLKKIAVLLTDGVYNTYRNWSGQNAELMSNYAQKVCREMKAAGITVYTVGFGLNELSEAERDVATTTLKECSSNHMIEDGSVVFKFYNVNTGTPEQTALGLKGAFRDIGLQLTKLRLTQ